MKAEEYQGSAIVTDLMDYGPVQERIKSIKTLRLLHAAMGMHTESGEFMDMLKKHILYGRELDTINLKEEIGDLFWYIALACDELNVSFEYLWQQNVDKLKARYGEKFSEHAALNRDLQKERRILEDMG